MKKRVRKPQAVPLPTGILYQDPDTMAVGQIWQLPGDKGFAPVSLVPLEETMKRLNLKQVTDKGGDADAS